MNILRARSASDIFTDDYPTTSDILGDKSLISKTPLKNDKTQVYPSDISSFPP